MKHGSLFSGIGGFDLAAQWMDWENIFHCEWNPFGQKILKHYWPNAISYEDITKTDFTIHRGSIDILTGGFPCQPYSMAGQRRGKEDERHLWPEMLRAIGEIQPRWVVGENVLGLVNWNGGMVFDEVQSDLEAQGYEVLPFILPAAGVNAPHKRDRVWFVAYCSDSGCFPTKTINERKEYISNDRNGIRTPFESNGEVRNASDTDYSRNATPQSGDNGNWQEESSKRQQSLTKLGGLVNQGDDSDTKSIRQEYALENGKLEGGRFRKSYKRNMWDSFPSKPPICGGDDGIPRQLDGITFSKWRNESIKGFGNAIVPQVVHQIFKAIEQYELSR